MLNFWRIVPRFIFFLWKCIKSQFLHLCFIQWPFWPLWSHFEVIHAKSKTQTGSTFAPRDFFDSDFGWKSPFSEWKEFCLANNNVVGSNLGYKLERAAHFSSFQARVFCLGILTHIAPKRIWGFTCLSRETRFWPFKGFWAFAFKAWLVQLSNEPLS